MRVEITTPPTTDLVSFALSPDGDKLAYVASSDGRPMLWLRSLATGEARRSPAPTAHRFRSGRLTAARLGISPTNDSIESTSTGDRCGDLAGAGGYWRNLEP